MEEGGPSLAGLFSKPCSGGCKDCRWQPVSPPNGDREGVSCKMLDLHLKAGILYSQNTCDGVA